MPDKKADLCLYSNQQISKREKAQQLIDQVEQFRTRVYDPEDKLSEFEIDSLKVLKPQLASLLERLAEINLEIMRVIDSEDEKQTDSENEDWTISIEKAIATIDILVERSIAKNVLVPPVNTQNANVQNEQIELFRQKFDQSDMQFRALLESQSQILQTLADNRNQVQMIGNQNGNGPISVNQINY